MQPPAPDPDPIERAIRIERLAQALADCIDGEQDQPVPIEVFAPALRRAYDLVMQRRLEAARHKSRAKWADHAYE